MRLLGDDGSSGVVLICPATGIPSQFYLSFARAATDEGFKVVMFDYDPAAPMEDWITKDIPKALRFAKMHAAEAPLFVVGHSIGAQALGLSPEWSEATGAIRVAASSGYVWHTRRPLLHAFKLLIFLPMLAVLFGAASKRLTGLGTDLSRSQVRTFVRWCRQRGYCHREMLAVGERLEIAIPVHDIFAQDDPYVTQATQSDLNRFYSFRNRSETKLGLDFGHVGFFAKRNENRWSEVFNLLKMWAPEKALNNNDPHNIPD